MTYRNTGIGIGPQNVTQESRIGHVARARNVGNLFHLRKLRRESSVHTDNLIVNDGTAGQAVKGIAELLPHLDREATTALVVKAINAINAGALVVATEQKEIFGILDFVGKEETDNLERLFAAINVVSEKEIVGLVEQECGVLIRWTALSQHLLYGSYSMYIIHTSLLTSGGKPPYSNNRNRSVYCPCTSPQILMGAPSSSNMGWLKKDFARLIAEMGGVIQGQIDWRPWLLVPGLQERIDHAVYPRLFAGAIMVGRDLCFTNGMEGGMADRRKLAKRASIR